MCRKGGPFAREWQIVVILFRFRLKRARVVGMGEKEIDMDYREVEEVREGNWVRAWERIAVEFIFSLRGLRADEATEKGETPLTTRFTTMRVGCPNEECL